VAEESYLMQWSSFGSQYLTGCELLDKALSTMI